MKIKALLLTLVFTAALTVEAAAADSAADPVVPFTAIDALTVKALSDVPLKAGTGDKSPVIKVYAKGEMFEVLGMTKNYYIVSARDGYVGALSKASVSVQKKAKPPARKGQIAQYTVSLFDNINARREDSRLAPFSYDIKLSEIAALKALNLADRGQLEHLSAEYGTPYQMLKNMGESCRIASENIVAGGTADEIFFNSFDTYADNINVSSPHFSRMGVGFAQSGEYGLIAVELFAA